MQQDFGAPSNSQAFGVGSGSTARWVYDNAAIEDDHVVWQASQSPCEALNQLMSDAIQPRNPTNSSLPKTWNPSPKSTTSGASTSSTSTLATASRNRRPKSRPHIGNTRNRSNGHSATESQTPFPPDPMAILSIIKEVSQKVDEESNTKCKAERMIERARAKEKLKQHPSVARQRKEKGKQRTKVTEGGMSGSSLAPDVGRKSMATAAVVPDEGDEETNMDVDDGDDSQKMPPPFLSMRNLSPAAGEPPAAATTLRSHGSSSTISGVSVTSAIGSLKATGSYVFTPPGSAAPTPTSSPILPLDDASVPPNRDRNVVIQPFAYTATPPLIAPASPRTAAAVAAPPRAPNPPAIKTTIPAVHVVHASSKPRSGPPALGMRRFGNGSQSLPLPSSQSFALELPTKQKPFKPPLVKASSPVLPPPAGATLAPVALPAKSARSSLTRTLSAGSNVGVACSGTRLGVKSDLKSKVTVDLPGFGAVPYPPKESTVADQPPKEGGSNLRKCTSAVIARSSSPPTEADESFNSVDFDMGIDEDEIERACSKYD